MHLSNDVIAGGGADDFLTVRHLRIEGTNHEIGHALATTSRSVHGAAAGPRPSVDPVVQRARRRWFAEHHPILAERGRGMAAAFGVEADSDDWDVVWLATYDTSPGCSVAFYPGDGTKDGHGILSRNFDFPTATFSEIVGSAARVGERPLAADPWVVELHPLDGGHASVTIGIMDVAGAMDGINDAGLTVALLADNESPHPDPTGGPQVGLSEQQIVRYLLDTCATVDDAKDALLMAKQYYFFVPCHFVVADRSGRSFVWEHSAGHNREAIVESDRFVGGRTVCTNHLLHPRSDLTDLPEEDGSLGTAALTYARWASLHDATCDGSVVDRDDIRDHFRAIRFEAPVVGARTFWQALYDVDDVSVDVSFYLRDEGQSIYSDPITLRLP
jgi:acyl-CoA:6-aminopenicillanic acid acyl transferase